MQTEQLTLGLAAVRIGGGVQSHHLRKLANRGDIPATKAGRFRLIDLRDIEAIRTACRAAGYYRDAAVLSPFARHRELAEHAVNRSLNLDVSSRVDSVAASIDQAVHEAVAAERERCAKVAEDPPAPGGDRDKQSVVDWVSEWIAATIREGKQ